jgi:F0F1-type ATP synthase membrane subunit b/b'
MRRAAVLPTLTRLTLKIARDSLISFENQAGFTVSKPLGTLSMTIMFFLAFAENIQLFPDGTIFIHIALILLMIWTLNRTFFRPVNKVIESRELQKGGRGGEAEILLQTASEKESQYQKAIAEARNQGYELIEKHHTAAVQERDSRLSTARSEIASRIASEKAELERQAAEAKAAIAAEAEQIAAKIASNILK